ncbi:Cyclin-like superfamily [Arabidopsis suecica]|uniref:Cyclin-like superfamily n=1 Tax=Arabidopsis suecica TaxID=45249 RepID=A0A8T1ZT90_ARASU|nr:Cyclin-like superfamily [Arabidopsis suecica]
MEEETCLDCKRPTITVIDHSSGDTICSECGLVLEAHIIEYSEEWRTFASDDNRSDRDPNRVGAPTNPLLKSGNLVTIIEKPKEISVVSKDDLSTLCRAQNQVKNHEEDLIKKAFEEIQRMTDALYLDMVIYSRACEIVSKFDGHANTKLRRGKKLYAVCAASVSMACRELKLSRTLKEIAMVANGVELKDIRKSSMVIKRVLESGQASVSAAIINTGELVRRFCSKLNISQREIMAIREAVEKAENFDIRRNPKSVLAAIIFMISHISQTNRRPIREIGIVAEVVENTIKNSVKDMYPYALKIIPNWYACEGDIIKRLDEFSGLQISLENSTIYMAGVKESDKEAILHTFPFESGALPVRYLGQLLLTKRMASSDYTQLIEKIRAPIGRQDTYPLLVVCNSLTIFGCPLFAYRMEIASLCSAFLWSGPDLNTKKAKVAWSDVCTPKEEGGLGLKSLKEANKVSCLKLIW